MSATAILGEAYPTTALGDWYANTVPTSRGAVVICTNELTLLTVILPLIEGEHPLSMFTMRVYNLLRHLGISAALAGAELQEMQSVEIRKAQNKRVLGTMNEIGYTIQLIAEKEPSDELNVSVAELNLAKFIFSYTKHKPPIELVRAIFAAKCSKVN